MDPRQLMLASESSLNIFERFEKLKKQSTHKKNATVGYNTRHKSISKPEDEAGVLPQMQQWVAE